MYEGGVKREQFLFRKLLSITVSKSFLLLSLSLWLSESLCFSIITFQHVSVFSYAILCRCRGYTVGAAAQSVKKCFFTMNQNTHDHPSGYDQHLPPLTYRYAIYIVLQGQYSNIERAELLVSKQSTAEFKVARCGH